MKFQFKSIRKPLRSIFLVFLAVLTFAASMVLNPNLPIQIALNQPIQLVDIASAQSGDKLPYDSGVSLSLSRELQGYTDPSGVYVQTHAGYDFAPAQNNPNNIRSRAFRDGKLESITYNEGSNGSCPVQGIPNAGFGNIVRIKHIVNNVAYYSKYAHLSSIDAGIANLPVGANIPQGTVLGVIGTVGCVTGTHLHFEYGTSIGGGAGNGLSVSFDEGLNGPSQNSGFASIKADFNGDRKTDILRQEKVGDSQYAITVMYSDGGSFQGGLTPIRDWQLMGQNFGTNAVKLYTGDFNGDGKSDLLRQERDSDGMRDVEIYYSNGNGFDVPVSIRWQTESAGGFKGGTNLILN